MDPVTAIVSAIAFAAPLVAKELIGASVKDAYAELKRVIATRFKRGAVVAAVEEAPDSKAARDGLAGALTETGAAEDSEIRRLAALLAEAIRALPAADLAAAGIERVKLEAVRDAIFEGNAAAGAIRDVSLKAGQDAVFRNNRAGESGPPKT